MSVPDVVVKDRSAMQLALSSCASALLSTEIPTNAPLMSIGLDSIAAVEFTNAVSDELGTSLSAIVLFDHPTLDSITSYLAVELEPDVLGVPVVDRGAGAGAGATLHSVP
jgi:acyl carrier protein